MRAVGGLVICVALALTSFPARGQSEAAPGSVDHGPSLPARSVSLATLEVADEQIDDGLPYYVLTGADTQLVVRSQGILQRFAAQTSSVVGYVVTPFDVDEIDLGSQDPTSQPLIHGALRIPVHALDTGTNVGNQLVRRLLNLSELPDLGLVLRAVDQVSEMAPIELAGQPSPRYSLTARGDLILGDRAVPLESQLELTFLGQTNATFSRSVGQLLSLRTSLEIPLSALGIEPDGASALQLGESVQVDVFLMFSTVSPDRPSVPLTPLDQHVAEAQIQVRLRDLGEYAEAYRQVGRYVEEIWDDAQALQRIATLILTEPGLEDRRPSVARNAAARAVKLTNREDALLLNTLARAQFECGEIDEAIRTQEEAITLAEAAGERLARALPRLRQNMERFRSADTASAPR